MNIAVRVYAKMALVVVAAVLMAGLCCHRDRLNPLDPNNPSTLGKEYVCRADSCGIGRVKLTWNTILQSEVSGFRVCRDKSGQNPVGAADGLGRRQPA